jgi:hypothetical protein
LAAPDPDREGDEKRAAPGVRPAAMKRSSASERFASGAILGPPPANKPSISARDTPCFWRFSRLPSSQSKRLISACLY